MTAENVLDHLLKDKAGHIRITCLENKPDSCSGSCQASLYQEDGEYKLITDIEQPDFMGSASFKSDNVIDATGQSVTVMAKHQNGTMLKMRLERIV